MRAPEDWTVDGVVDARRLPQHIQRGNLPAVLHLISRIEYCRRWVIVNARHLQRFAHHFRITAKDTRSLNRVLDDENEGIIRFAITDLNWRRRVRFHLHAHADTH